MAAGLGAQPGLGRGTGQAPLLHSIQFAEGSQHLGPAHRGCGSHRLALLCTVHGCAGQGWPGGRREQGGMGKVSPRGAAGAGGRNYSRHEAGRPWDRQTASHPGRMFCRWRWRRWHPKTRWHRTGRLQGRGQWDGVAERERRLRHCKKSVAMNSAGGALTGVGGAPSCGGAHPAAAGGQLLQPPADRQPAEGRGGGREAVGGGRRRRPGGRQSPAIGQLASMRHPSATAGCLWDAGLCLLALLQRASMASHTCRPSRAVLTARRCTRRRTPGLASRRWPSFCAWQDTRLVCFEPGAGGGQAAL